MSKQDECQAKAQAQILCFALLILDQRKGFLVYFMSGYVVTRCCHTLVISL